MTEHKFVVKLVCHLSDKPEALIQYAFGTRKEAEEYQDLALYAMKLNYGTPPSPQSSVISPRRRNPEASFSHFFRRHVAQPPEFALMGKYDKKPKTTNFLRVIVFGFLLFSQ